MISHSDTMGRDWPSADNPDGSAFRKIAAGLTDAIAYAEGVRCNATLYDLPQSDGEAVKAQVRQSAAKCGIPDDLPDHADAFASVLEYYAARIRAGGNTEDLAVQLLPVVRIAARLI